jgi:pyruvate carboxylase
VIAAARRAGADAIYPGYGFLSENPDLAQACADAGITFVGTAAGGAAPDRRQVPRHRRRPGGRPAGPRVVGAVREIDELVAAADELGFPLFVKAVAGGGGRGMRRVDEPGQLRESAAAAMREAQAAFGDATVFLERAVVNPRHIEVQILADSSGGVVHLYERDCSLQRRHQKVIEIAPAQNLDPGVRDRICADAVAFARHIGYVNAGTVEFLLDERGQHVFIEMNPRIQVEHTVTEQVTGRDLVIAQLRVAAGMTLPEMDLQQEQIHVDGAALQCRVTTEDPANGFRPDTA